MLMKQRLKYMSPLILYIHVHVHHACNSNKVQTTNWFSISLWILNQVFMQMVTFSDIIQWSTCRIKNKCSPSLPLSHNIHCIFWPSGADSLSKMYTYMHPCMACTNKLYNMQWQESSQATACLFVQYQLVHRKGDKQKMKSIKSIKVGATETDLAHWGLPSSWKRDVDEPWFNPSTNPLSCTGLVPSSLIHHIGTSLPISTTLVNPYDTLYYMCS